MTLEQYRQAGCKPAIRKIVQLTEEPGRKDAIFWFRARSDVLRHRPKSRIGPVRKRRRRRGELLEASAYIEVGCRSYIAQKEHTRARQNGEACDRDDHGGLSQP